MPGATQRFRAGQELAREKVYPSVEAALAGVFDGAVVLVSGFAGEGVPHALLEALSRMAVKGLSCICSPVLSPGQTSRGFDVPQLVASGKVRRLISPLPVYPGTDSPVEQRRLSGQLEVEVVPQGVLAERLRAGGAGLGGVFLHTGAGTRFGEGKEAREFDGRRAVLELPIRADFALVRAEAADTRQHHAPTFRDAHHSPRVKIKLTFWPPKPNEFDIATETDAERAVRGTQSKGMSGSGSSRCAVGGISPRPSVSTVATASSAPAAAIV